MKITEIKLYGSNKPGTDDGQAQTDHLKWLGKHRSSTEIKNRKTVSGTTNVGGVTMVTAGPGNANGNGTLTYTHNGGTGRTLQWTPSGGTIGSAVVVDTNAQYNLHAGSGKNEEYLVVSTVALNLPTANASDTDINISNHADTLLNMFDDVLSADASAGKTSYRAGWIKNEHASETAKNVKIFIRATTPAAGDSFKFAVEDPTDSGGNRKGTSNLIKIQEITNETTQPASLTWVDVTTEGTAIAIAGSADLLFGESTAFWLERTVLAGAAAFPANALEIAIFWDIDNIEN